MILLLTWLFCFCLNFYTYLWYFSYSWIHRVCIRTWNWKMSTTISDNWTFFTSFHGWWQCDLKVVDIYLKLGMLYAVSHSCVWPVCFLFSDFLGWLEFAGVENDRPAKNRGWNLQDWKMTDEVAGVEYAGVENDGRSRRGGICRTGKWRTGK